MGDKIRIKEDAFDGDNYEPTDSDEYYSEEEQELLKEVRAGRKHDVEPTKELMAFDESDDDDDDDEDDDVGALLRDSDIEGAEDTDDDLPDPMDWGSKARNYYNTDFVDPDYDAYTAEEEAMALEEEAEAMRIQKRLLKQMTERDFIPEYMDIKPTNEKKVDPKEPAETIVIKADLAGLSANDKLKLLEEDSPEFLRLTSDFEVHMKEVNTLVSPVLQYVRKHNVPMIPALQFAKLYQDISLTYCNNIAFYLVLKAKRIPIRTHPVIQRLLQLKKLLQQLEDKYQNIIHPQLEALLERIVDGDQFEVLDVKRKADKAKKKSKLSILGQFDAEGKIDASGEKDAAASDAVASSDNSDGDGEVEGEDDEAAEQAGKDARRGITYQIAKNKGLTPHRKKELRNPRVKHRSKFRKALIRRKGAVRTVRHETKRYGGEISGIKATVSKSIKFKV